MLQEIIVYLIIAATAFIIVRHVWKQAKSKRSGCSCGSCGKCPEQCHCDATQK